MGDLEQGKRIKQRILNSDRRYTKEERKAELMLRNNTFIKERMAFPSPEYRLGYESISVHKDFIRKAREGVDAREELLRILREEPKHNDIRMAWLYFCYRWGINWWWDGRGESLPCNINLSLEVFYREAYSSSISIRQQGSNTKPPSYPWVRSWDHNFGKEPAFVYVKIRPWTSKEDFISYWRTIENLKKIVFGYSEGETSMFSRDLCWFDLHESEEFGKLSYEDIRRRWNNMFKRKRSVRARVTVQKAVERIKFCSERLTPAIRFSIPVFTPKYRSV